jgi:hypothetical protein
MSPRTRNGLIVGGIAAVVGTAVWLKTMGSVPRYAREADESLGDLAFYPVMMFLAFIGGAIAPRRAWLVGLMLGLPALILSPWTAPRGENDDVWLFIPPVLAVFDVMLIGIAWLGGLVRDSFEQAFEESRTGKKTRL